MSWNTGTSYSGSSPVNAALVNGIGNDFRTWGGNVDAAGYELTNCAAVRGAAGANPLIFKTNGAERMRIDGAGNVGIGMAPTVPLHIHGPQTLSTVQQQWDLFSGVVAQLNTGSDANLDFGTATSHSFCLMAGGARKFVVYPTGQVGFNPTNATQDDLFLIGGNGSLAHATGSTFRLRRSYDNIDLFVFTNPSGVASLGIGIVPTSPLHIIGIPVYANNAAAIAGGLTAGAFYRTGANPDPICVVH